MSKCSLPSKPCCHNFEFFQTQKYGLLASPVLKFENRETRSTSYDTGLLWSHLVFEHRPPNNHVGMPVHLLWEKDTSHFFITNGHKMQMMIKLIMLLSYGESYSCIIFDKLAELHIYKRSNECIHWTVAVQGFTSVDDILRLLQQNAMVDIVSQPTVLQTIWFYFVKLYFN